MSDEKLSECIHKDGIEIYVLYVKGVPAGYAEIDRCDPVSTSFMLPKLILYKDQC